MRALLLALALALGFAPPLVAQDAEQKKPAARKPAAAKKAHQKPTKDQVRKFNELEKKQK